MMTWEEVEAVVARGRPGWRVVDVAEVNGEAGPSYKVVIERGKACIGACFPRNWPPPDPARPGAPFSVGPSDGCGPATP